MFITFRMSDPKSQFKQSIKDKLKKHLPGKKSALEAPKDAKSLTSEDAMGRRTWDSAGFSALAETRLKKDIEKMTKYGPDANLEKRDLPSSMRDPVQARKNKVDLDSGVGKTKAISFENGNNGKGSGGYYCSVCDVNVKDSRAYLNHLNGRRHQRNMGFNPYKIEQSTVDDVRTKFAEKKKQREEILLKGARTYEKQKEEDMEKAKLDAEWHAQYKRECKKAKKRKIKEATEALDDPLTESMMGFASFGGKKKK